MPKNKFSPQEREIKMSQKKLKTHPWENNVTEMNFFMLCFPGTLLELTENF